MKRILLIAAVCVVLVSTTAGAVTVTAKHDERNRVGHLRGSETRRNSGLLGDTIFESRIVDAAGTYTRNPQTNFYTLTMTGTLQVRSCLPEVGCSLWHGQPGERISLYDNEGRWMASGLTARPNGNFAITVTMFHYPPELQPYTMFWPGQTVRFHIPPCSAKANPTPA